MSAKGSDVLEVLGGRHALGADVGGLLDITRAVSRGLPWQSAARTQQAFDLGDEELAEILGISIRTLYRHRRAAMSLSPQSSDRLARAVRVIEYAIEVIEDKAAALHWMRRAQHGLNDGVPLELLQTDYGAREVEHLLGRIDHGVLS